MRAVIYLACHKTFLFPFDGDTGGVAVMLKRDLKSLYALFLTQLLNAFIVISIDNI
jgi:hypothetical protein